MDKRDSYIKEKLKKDQTISNKCNNIFKKFKGGDYMIDKEKKVIKISLKSFIAIAASVAIVGTIGINLYAKSKGKANMISSLQALTRKDDEVNQKAKELFEKATTAVRDGLYNETDTDDIKEVNGVSYAKTEIKYSELKQKYEEIFTEEALENAIALNVIDVEGIAYGVPKAGPGYTIENITVERINENKGELTYNAKYLKAYIDSPTKEENTCQFKIKKVNEEYRISETNYMGLDEKPETIGKEIILDKHLESSMGISFDYSSKWEYVDNNKGSGIIMVGLNKPSNNDNKKDVSFTVTYAIIENAISAKQLMEKEMKGYKIDEQGEIIVDGFKGYYCITKNEERNTTHKGIYVQIDSLVYCISYDGNKELYNEHYDTYEKMLSTIKFTKPTYIEEWKEKDYEKYEVNPSNDSGTSLSTLIGDANCDGVVNNKDLTAINKHLRVEQKLTAQGHKNADVNDDGEVTSADIEVLSLYLAGTYKTLPQKNNSTLCGDVNCDGVVNNKDLTALNKHINNGASLSAQGKANADVNDDDEVNAQDVTIIMKYLSGEYSRLPQRTSGLELISKSLPGVDIKYPKDWEITEINKDKWKKQPGRQTCRIDGSVNNVEVEVTVYEPLYIVGEYKNLFKSECSKYGISYYDGIEDVGYNIGSTSASNLEWRCLQIHSGLRIYYHMADKDAGEVIKIEVRTFNYLEGNNMLPAERVIDDIILSATMTSY